MYNNYTKSYKRREASKGFIGPMRRSVGRYDYRKGGQNFRTGGYTGIEKKFLDSELQSQAFGTGWETMSPVTLNCLNGIATGTGESGRIGRKYLILSVHMKVVITIGAIESDTTPIGQFNMRIALVIDHQTNNAELTATDVMDPGGTRDLLAFRNLQHTGRFNVLWDKRFHINSNGQTNEGAVNLFAIGGQATRVISYDKTFKTPLIVICDGTDNTIGSITTNSLQVIGVSNSTSAVLSYQARVRYTG